MSENRVIKDNIVEKILDRIVVVCGNASAVFLLILMLLIFTDVFCRYFFKSPILGGIELVEVLMAVMISLALSYGQYLKRHVFVEIFYQRLRGRGKAIVDIIISILCFFIYILISYNALKQAEYLSTTTLSTTTLLIPVWPFRLVLAIGAFIFCLAIARDTISYIKNLIYKREKQEKEIDIAGSI